MIDQSKRRLLFTTATVVATSMFGIRVREVGAQTNPAPQPQETEYFLSSRYRLELLIGRLFAIRNIAIRIVIEEEGIEYKNRKELLAIVKRKFPAEPNVTLGSRYALGVVMEPRENKVRQNLLKTLPADYRDGMKRASERLAPTVMKLAAKAAERELELSNQAVSDAINSLHHAERIAVLRKKYDGDEPWYCRRFPFSWFCRDKK